MCQTLRATQAVGDAVNGGFDTRQTEDARDREETERRSGSRPDRWRTDEEDGDEHNDAKHFLK